MLKRLTEACRKGDISDVIEYINDGDDPSSDDNLAIKVASEHNHIEVVKLLLKDKRVDPTADDNYAIRWASNNLNIEVVKLLLEDYRFKMTDALYKHRHVMQMFKDIRQEKLNELCQID